MSTSKKKILLLGPGHGNNLNVVLDIILDGNRFEISLLTRKYYRQNARFNEVQVYEFDHHSKIICRLKELYTMFKIPKQDILLILGGGNLYETIPAILLIKREKTIFNIWSEGVPNALKKKNLKSILLKKVLNSCEIIWCNWYGTADLLRKNAPEFGVKIIVQGWGLNKDFLEHREISNPFTEEFIKNLPQDKVTFINMRSLTAYNEVDLILESALIIRDKYPECFSKLLIIFWHGNNIDEIVRERIKSYITNNDMHDAIWCVEHPFLPSSDIRHVINAMDVVMNYVKHDQLSISILEAMYLRKCIVASNIPAYRLLNEKMGTQLALTPLSATSLAEDICACILQCIGGNFDRDLLNKRKQIVEDNFGRDSGIKNIVDMIENV